MSNVVFFKIYRSRKSISLVEWNEVVNAFDELVAMPNRIGINPFNGEESVFSGVGKAIYRENGTLFGNASLENGVILTTGVPASFCSSIASYMQARYERDDRS